MGAPLPSRFLVIERIQRSIQKEDLCGHIKYKNSHIAIRTLKLMSKNDSLYKRFLLEVSLEHFDRVIQENFWPPGVRVRIFKGNGKHWNDRDEENAEENGDGDENGDIDENGGVSSEHSS